MSILFAILFASPMFSYVVIPPWPHSYERPVAGITYHATRGSCVEVCWKVDGKMMGCSAVQEKDTGLTTCPKHNKKGGAHK